MSKPNISSINRICLIIIITLLLLLILAQVNVHGSEKQIVKVGWNEYAGFQETDENGNPGGYNYEYLKTIEKRSNLTFEFVQGDWDEMLDMLETGEIDILGGMALTEARALEYDYCSVPNGTSIIMLITKDKDKFGYNDLDALEGVKIATLNSQYRIDAFKDFEIRKDFNSKLIVCNTDKEVLDKLDSGEVEVAMLGSMYNFSGYDIITQFDLVPYYFIAKKNANKNILAEIADTIAEIRTLNKNYEQELDEEYFNRINTIAFTVEENKYISENNVIRIGINANRKVLAYIDETTGEFEGIEVDYIKALAQYSGLNIELVELDNCNISAEKFAKYNLDAVIGVTELENQDESFEYIPYMVEKRGFVVARGSKLNKNLEDVRVAIPKNALKSEEYLKKEFPNWEILYFNTEECLDYVSSGLVDAAIVSQYEFQYYMQIPKYENLTNLTDLSVNDQKTVAVSEEAPKELITILDKSIGYISDNEMSDITYDSLSKVNYQYTLVDNLVDNSYLVLLIIVAIITLIGLYLLRTNKKIKVSTIVAEDALKEAVKSKNEAENANSVKTDFLSRMSHDMRTPMSTVIGLSNFGIEENRDEQDVSYFNQIKESSEYLLGLLNDILDMQKIEYGNVELMPELIECKEIMDEVISIINNGIQKKDIDFSYSSTLKEEVVTIEADKLRVEQILINVLSNAIKYTPKGGKIEWEISYTKDEVGNYSVVNIIKDTGVGMTEEFMGKIFEPFTQEKNKLTTSEGGSGLGLAITKNLVEMMGGSISCSSKLNKGSTFEIILPVKVVSKERLIKREYNLGKTIKNNFAGKKILLCEDNDINSIIIIKILNNKEIDVDRAENGQVGVELARANGYDAILMDIRMPVMDGLVAAKKIRKLDSKTPIIALSANAYKSDIDKSLKAGMNEHLAKPINSDLLFKVLAKYL